VKIYVYPADMDGCGYYRLIWPATALKLQGHDVTVVLPSDRSKEADPKLQIQGDVRNGTELLDIRYPEDADVIVLQRVTNMVLCQGVAKLREKGVAVVVDMDDDLGAIDPWHIARYALDPRAGRIHSWANAERACRDATVVTVSTPPLLKEYARHGRGVVLPNHVLREMWDIQPNRETRRFGWTGSLHSHPQDPSVVGPAVQRLVRDGFEFAMIGNTKGVTIPGEGNPTSVREAFGLDEDPWTTGPVKVTDWAAALTNLYVGMAPLRDTKFNRAKSWLKPLELAALGIPCVSSPLPEYRRANEAGIGVLAAQPRDWYRELRKLLTDETWREEVAGRSQEAAAGLILEDNAWRWAEAWTDAYVLQGRESPATV